ncbi:MAG: polysaccharide biosynthesis C-terminal domain-containing protein, partial [Saprospiraceae bacterium]
FGAVTDATGRAALNFRVTFFTAILNLGLSALMIPTYGLFGAAWATLCGYAISFAVMQFFLNRLFGVRWYRAFGHIGSFYLLAWDKIQIHWRRMRSPQVRL